MAAKKGTAPADEKVAEDVAEGQDDAGQSGFAKFIDYSDPVRTVITFRDRKFWFPASRAKWPTRAMQAFQKRLNADGVEMLFGPQQWDMFNQVAPEIGDFWEFFPIFAEAAGFVKQD